MVRTRRRLCLSALAAAIFLGFWSPVLTVPFWRDDYYFLSFVRQVYRAGRPWFAGLFFDAPHDTFMWRPLSYCCYWPLVGRLFGGDARAAHALNIALLLLASAAVGWLATLLLRICWPASDAPLVGILAASLYGLHGAHFLTAAFACVSNQSLVIFFCALSLGFWLICCTAVGVKGWLAGGMTIVCSAAALLNKESGAVLPLLQLLLLAWIWPQRKPTLRVWIIGLLSLGVTGIWWLVRRRLGLPPPPPEYALHLGLHVPRNAISMGLFLLNVPRESLRFVLEQHSPAAGLWAVACLALEVAGCTLLLRGMAVRLSRRDYCLAAAFTITGCAPCLLLSWNCYEYYVSLGLIPYAILLGLAASQTRRARLALFLIVASAAISTAGNYLLPYPAVIARAHWAQRQLAIVTSIRDADPKAFRGPVYLYVENDHKFQGFGIDGLAYTLDKQPKDFIILDSAKPTMKAPWTLVVPAEGDVYCQ